MTTYHLHSPQNNAKLSLLPYNVPSSSTLPPFLVKVGDPSPYFEHPPLGMFLAPSLIFMTLMKSISMSNTPLETKTDLSLFFVKRVCFFNINPYLFKAYTPHFLAVYMIYNMTNQ